MKNTLIAILVVIILVGAYLFIREKTAPTDYSNVWPETEPATPTNNQGNSNNNSAPQEDDYEYKNTQGGFYVDLSGRITSESTTAGQHRIFFDKPNRGVNEPRDFYVRYFNSTEWQQSWSSSSTTYDYVGTVTYNGITFQHYTRPAVDPGINDPKLLHFYMTNNDGIYYEIYSQDPSYLSSFGFI